MMGRRDKEMTREEVREYVKRVFPYSSVQPFLSSLIKYGEYTNMQPPQTPEFIEGRVYFDVDKFWDEMTERLWQAD